MKTTLKTFAAALAALAVTAVGFCDRVDSEVLKARQRKGKMIRCSPLGEEGGGPAGTVTVQEAAKNLYPGMILEMTPGDYAGDRRYLRFSQDNITVQGDGSGGYVDAQLVFEGSDIVVRSIYAKSVEGDRIIIIDSKFHGLVLTNGLGRPRPVVYNCCFNSMALYPNRSDISVKNCSVVTAHSYRGKDTASWRYSSRIRTDRGRAMIKFGRMVKTGDVHFDRCLLYNNHFLFGFLRGSNASSGKLIALKLDDNLIYCGAGLVKPPKDDSPKVGKEIKELNTYFDFKGQLKGNILDHPKLSMVPEKANSRSGLRMNRDYFVLVDGKYKDTGVGANMGTKGIPVPREDFGK